MLRLNSIPRRGRGTENTVALSSGAMSVPSMLHAWIGWSLSASSAAVRGDVCCRKRAAGPALLVGAETGAPLLCRLAMAAG
jgi:hypothetical protein